MFGPGFGGGRRGRFGRLDRRVQEEEKPDARLDFARLLRYLKPYRVQIAITLLVSLSVTLLNIIPPRLIGIIIDKAIGKGEHATLYLAATTLLIIYISAACLGGVKSYLLGRTGQKITRDFWQDVYGSLQRLSFNFYDENQTGSIMSRITNDVLAVERVLVDGVDTIIIASMTLIGIAVILFKINMRLAFVTMIPIPLLGFLAWIVTIRSHTVYREVRQKMGEMSALIQDGISGIREIKSFAREEYEEERLSEKSADYMGSSVQAIRLWSFFSPLIITTTSIGTFLVILYGGNLAIHGTLTPGEVVSFLLYLGLFYQPVHQLNFVNHMFQHARAASERIFEVIDAIPQVAEAPHARPLIKPVRGNVEFQDVNFSYKPGEEVLHGITFSAKQGEIIALVGATGAGKSTIVSLIPRFYDAQKGEIRLDGINVKELRLKELREHIGIVMQEPFLFNASIMENIAYGKLNATMDEVVQAATLANAHTFISSLPEGYHHQVGERGIKLSVGEKQRIAIARALLKNPPILILDEATSSVDNKTEALIQEAIDHLLRNRTSFVIAHRLSTVMHANKILVIEKGYVIEEGTHTTLLEKNGAYAKLYRIQWRHSLPEDPGLFNNL
ncbi:MAG: ABC transporter ATP-binding protein [Candidatus Ratteibacteria bacterium]|jgi:ABC-type multidrug transport system fused ATPase/permease subunit